MTDTIIDMIRVPVTKNGEMIYNTEEMQKLLKTYTELYPNHKVFIMPSEISLWEKLNIVELEGLVEYLTKIIKEKKGIDN